MTSEGSGPERRVRTVLMTDIVSSTETAARLGDRRWRQLLERHRTAMRLTVESLGGTGVESAGDRFLALFAEPGDALRCALAAVEAAPSLGLQIRAGVHTGECDDADGSVTGIGLHLSARIVALAEPGEVLVSSTVRDLVAGTDLAFVARGTHRLKGMPRPWRVYAVSAAQLDDQPEKPTTRRRPGTTSRTERPQSAPRLRVLLVDDHPLWRQTLRSVIERGRFAVVVAEAASGAEAVDAARRANPDVVVMDIQMPGVDGVEATRRLLEDDPSKRVLVLSSSDERHDVSRALRAGAAGYILKTADSTAIREAIRRVAAGDLAFPNEVAPLVLQHLRGDAPEPAPTGRSSHEAVSALTPRERQILELMAEGCSNQAVAERLHVSMKTVETHTGSIFAKLGVAESQDAHRRVLAVVTYLKAADPEVGAGPDRVAKGRL